MVTLNRNWFQNFYCGCLSENFIKLLSATIDGEIKEARDEDDNIIISDSTLRSLLPFQLKKCCQDTRSCVVVNVSYLTKVFINNYYHGVIFI